MDFVNYFNPTENGTTNFEFTWQPGRVGVFEVAGTVAGGDSITLQKFVGIQSPAGWVGKWVNVAAAFTGDGSTQFVTASGRMRAVVAVATHATTEIWMLMSPVFGDYYTSK